MILFTKSYKEEESFHVLFDETEAAHHLALALRRRLINRPNSTEVIFVCIGTDRSTGDALGPLVGSYLSEMHRNTLVYGTLIRPVHAVNLAETITLVEKTHVSPFIVAVDACLGQLSSVGQITLSDGALQPGAGVHKKLPQIGHVHITGIVNVGGFMEYFVLQNTRLGIVVPMAKVIADAIALSISELTYPHLQAEADMSLKKEVNNSRWGAFFRGKTAP